jgi:hypothetical protein
MSQISFHAGLPFISVVLYVKSNRLVVQDVLLDTGSYATMFKASILEQYGLHQEVTDITKRILGVGGVEFVTEKKIEGMELGELVVRPMTIQLGRMDYGIPMNGILGVDFLVQAGAVVDFKKLEIRKG